MLNKGIQSWRAYTCTKPLNSINPFDMSRCLTFHHIFHFPLLSSVGANCLVSTHALFSFFVSKWKNGVISVQYFCISTFLELRSKDNFFPHQKEMIGTSVCTDNVQMNINHNSHSEWSFFPDGLYQFRTVFKLSFFFYSDQVYILIIYVHLNIAIVTKICRRGGLKVGLSIFLISEFENYATGGNYMFKECLKANRTRLRWNGRTAIFCEGSVACAYFTVSC